MLDSDIREAKHHLDLSDGYPFKSHATPIEDLDAIAESVQKGTMPPLFYRIMHRSDAMTHEEKKAVLECGLLRCGVNVHGNAAAVIFDRHGSIVIQGDAHVIGVAGHRFVDGVVDDFPHEVVQTAHIGGTDVHAGALADRLKTFQNLDLLRGVFLGCHNARSVPF
jgi:hypothetical protein